MTSSYHQHKILNSKNEKKTPCASKCCPYQKSRATKKCFQALFTTREISNIMLEAMYAYCSRTIQQSTYSDWKINIYTLFRIVSTFPFLYTMIHPKCSHMCSIISFSLTWRTFQNDENDAMIMSLLDAGYSKVSHITHYTGYPTIIGNRVGKLGFFPECSKVSPKNRCCRSFIYLFSSQTKQLKFSMFFLKWICQKITFEELD